MTDARTDARTQVELIAELKALIKEFNHIKPVLEDKLSNGDNGVYVHIAEPNLIKIIESISFITKNIDADWMFFELSAKSDLTIFNGLIRDLISISDFNSFKKDFLINAFHQMQNDYKKIYKYIQLIRLEIVTNNANLQLAIGDTDQFFSKTKQKMANIASLQDDAEKILADAKGFSGTSGVAKSYNFFEDASDKYDVFSIKWAKITFALFFITFALSFYNFYFMNDIPADGYELVVFISKRIFIFALLIYSIIFSGRIYMANWHNYVINKHKQNALQTFLELVTATKAEDKKDIILTFAANCIYTQQETGFSNEKSSSNGSPAEQIAKLAEAINKAQKKSSE